MSGELPVMLSVRGRCVVIVGGGTVAARKARAMLGAGACRVRVVAPEFRASLPGEVERVEARFRPSHLSGCSLALACTDDKEVNDRVVRAARERGILVGRADRSEREPGDFTMMALRRLGPIVLACHGGGSPGMARRVVGVAAEAIDPDLVELAALLHRWRPSICSDRARSAKSRRALLAWLSSDEALAIFREGGSALLLQRAAERFPSLPQTDASP